MNEEDRILSINYLNLLSALEQAARAKQDDPIEDGDRGRIRNYGQALLKFLGKAFKRRDADLGRTTKAIGIAAKGIRDKEAKLLRSIVKATSPGKGFSGEETVTAFPGKIPPKDVVGRLVATVLGLHAESRHDPDVSARLRQCLGRAVENILAPALAWNLMVDISQEHPDHHDEILTAARNRVQLAGVGANYADVEWSKGKTTLPSLLMLRAWARLLSNTFKFKEKDVRDLLAKPLAEAIGGRDLPTIRERLHPKVTEAFGWGEHASERTLAIALANRSGATAALVDRRIALLKAAASAEAREWNALLQKDEVEALNTAEVELNERSLTTLQAAGKAFWLSRHCFRKTTGGQFFTPPNGHPVMLKMPTDSCARLDKASKIVLQLMDLAASHDTATPEQVLLLRRFQAGFATNPRYWRGKDALKRGPELVNTYRSLAGHKPGLVKHFEARLALQKWYADQDGKRSDKLVPTEALRCYQEVLDLSPSLTEMIDAEAPIHLFPEIIVLLGFGPDGDPKLNDALEDVDLILKCNFGVYMDIEDEKSAIIGGLEQAKSWKMFLSSTSTAQV